jgi:hypothetical protein
MPAYTTVTEELAAKYPKLAGRAGETITSQELAAAQRTEKEPATKEATPETPTEKSSVAKPKSGK